MNTFANRNRRDGTTSIRKLETSYYNITLIKVWVSDKGKFKLLRRIFFVLVLQIRIEIFNEVGVTAKLKPKITIVPLEHDDGDTDNRDSPASTLHRYLSSMFKRDRRASTLYQI
ncbi:hypothetical protein DICVIV_13554 [Dictyocaulus viviparus]|uniref:Uncharacterized protein n=1 Tax=Dictyocaulus viviparus TaxID=29172 RepID=A0A0D8X7H7_DICVI|nr:hypothetical protein DICVIV_13554 [Dictyocaulus viviparus]